MTTKNTDSKAQLLTEVPEENAGKLLTEIPEENTGELLTEVPIEDYKPKVVAPPTKKKKKKKTNGTALTKNKVSPKKENTFEYKIAPEEKENTLEYKASPPKEISNDYVHDNETLAMLKRTLRKQYSVRTLQARGLI